MATVTTTYQYLSRKPKSLYQQLFIKDRWIAARTLYGMSVGEDAMRPDEIAADYHLPLEAVLEAIAYCRSNPPEIAADYAAEEALIAASGAADKTNGKPRLLSPDEMS